MADDALPNVDGYVFGHKIGSGSFAEVYKAVKKTDSKGDVAIKCVKKSALSKTSTDNLITEIRLLKKMDHKHIVKLQDFAWDDNYIYLIMEHCSGGDLSHFIKKHVRLNEVICQRFLQQLAVALKFLRNKNISHFDLKPQNILLSSKHLHILKIGDFGLAQLMEESDTNTHIKGSPLYMAPEIIIEKKYDVKADIWSVGVILYECLFGKAPYSSPTIDELLIKIKESKPIRIPHNSVISSACRDFLRKCLERNPQNRMDFEMFFNHPFVDMIHAPSDQSFDAAEECITIATCLESEGKAIEAYDHYNDAIKYLAPVMYTETRADRRTNIKKQIYQYVRRMEEIKKTTSSKDTPAIFNPLKQKHFDICSGNVSELVALGKSTPSMNSAIEIAQSAELYCNEAKFEIGLEKYQMALGKLLGLMGSEPPGRRKKLLMSETTRWMKQAEAVKKYINPDTRCVGELLEAEAEKTCLVQ